MCDHIKEDQVKCDSVSRQSKLFSQHSIEKAKCTGVRARKASLIHGIIEYSPKKWQRPITGLPFSRDAG